jgi:molybdate transport system permease protein
MDESSLWASLWLSLRVSLVATCAATALAVPLAYIAARRRFPGRLLVETALTLPLVLPPTVVGYLIIVTLGARGVAGRWLFDATGYSLLFRFEGAVLAAAIVALPLIYLPTKSAFASIDRELEDIARLMGATRRQTFFHVSLPLASNGIFAGVVLGFARALGEFGATVMVYGFGPSRETLPISVYRAYEQGQMPRAAPAVMVLMALSLGLLALYNRLPGVKR